MSPSEFPLSAKNRVRQVAKRGVYDRETVYQILDRSLICHVAFVNEDSPFVIPMLFARRNDELLFHGSTKSRLMQLLTSGRKVCISVAILDGLVLAKSLFHHSMNYRSVSVFGEGRELTNEDDRLSALQSISEKVMPQRWDDARLPNALEMKATCVAAIKIETASAKIRTGGPVDDPDDVNLPVWSGVVPLRQVADSPIRDEQEGTELATPEYVEAWQRQFNSRERHS